MRCASSDVRRRQDAKRAPRRDVLAERLQHRVDSGAADERHHDVDAVGRIDLGDDLTAEHRLAGRS